MTVPLTDETAFDIEFDADDTTLRIVRPAELAPSALPLLLVANREPLVGSLVRRLTELRWHVIVARTAEEAGRRVMAESFAGILLDATMERAAGLPLLRARNEHNADLSVILIGGEDADRLVHAVADGTGGAHACAEGGDLSRLVSLLDGVMIGSRHRRVLRRATHLLGTGSAEHSPETNDLITPPAVRAMQRLGELLAGQRLTAEAIEQAVARCPAVADGVLRLANRVRRASGERYATLLEAINWQGIVRIGQMTEVLAARFLFEIKDPAIARTVDTMWRYGLARAEAMRLLSERPELPPRCWFNDLYAAGLFADAGAVFILWLIDQAEPPIGPAPVVGDPTFRLIADHHEWMGEELARRWGMGHEIARLAGNHHPRPNRLHLPFWPLGLAASDLADEIVDSPERAALRSPSAGAAIDALGLDARGRRDLLGAVRENVERLVEAIEDAAPRRRQT